MRVCTTAVGRAGNVCDDEQQRLGGRVAALAAITGVDGLSQADYGLAVPDGTTQYGSQNAYSISPIPLPLCRDPLRSSPESAVEDRAESSAWGTAWVLSV